MWDNLQPLTALLYVALAEFVLTFLAFLLQQRQLGWAQYALAFSMTLAAVVLRAMQTRQPPMGNLYEVFLVLATLMFPLSLFSRYVLKVGGVIFDVLLAAVLLVPAAFVFSPEPKPLPPALQSPFFTPHVLAYMLSYVILAKAAAVGIVGVIRERRDFGLQISDCGLKKPQSDISWDRSVYRLVCLGFPFLTAGLLTGSLWGKQAWGDWWNWDPKELWSLATWLVYAAYFHVRTISPRRNAKLELTLILVGLVCIVITLLWVNLSRVFPGLHSYAM